MPLNSSQPPRNTLGRQQARRPQRSARPPNETAIERATPNARRERFKHAERLTIRPQDRALQQFLVRRAKHLAEHWMRFFNRYKGRGRPRKDEAQDALRQHQAGTSWHQIRVFGFLRREAGQHTARTAGTMQSRGYVTGKAWKPM